MAAEEAADGRVRVPKVRRKPGEVKPRGRKGEEPEDLTASN
jgi:hypothetical protein